MAGRLGLICGAGWLLIASCGPVAPIERSHGTYKGHRWEITEGHLLLWDEKPYVRYGFTGNGPVEEMVRMGFTQFNVAPSEDWAMVDDPKRLADIVKATDEYTDLLERVGATYYAVLNVFWPWRYGERIKDDADKVVAFVRDIVDLTGKVKGGREVKVKVGLPVHPAEREKAKVASWRLLLFDLDGGRVWDVTGRLEAAREIPPPERASGDEARKWFLLRLRPLPSPRSGDLRLVVGARLLLYEVPDLGPSSIPALWKPGIIRHYRRSLLAFRKAYAKDGLRGMMFGDEINAWRMGLLGARSYLDLSDDPVALEAYRQWLRRRFGTVGRLNRAVYAKYRAFEEVPWLVPLHPFTEEDLEAMDERRLGAVVERLARYKPFPFESLAHLKAAGEVQDEFRVWFYGYWLAQYARMAKEVIGNVPVFVCSASIGGDAHEYLRVHWWALIHGVDGLIRNCYGHPRLVGGRPEIFQPGGGRFPLETLVRWMEEVQEESGKTKHLFANEIGHPNEFDEEVADDFGLGRAFAFPSKEALRDFMLAMVDYGYKGLNLFAMNPLHPARLKEVRWMAELRDEIVRRIVGTKRYRRNPPRGVEEEERALGRGRLEGGPRTGMADAP